MFNCACIEVEPNDFEKSETRRAGRHYKCGECGAAIKPGELHEYTACKGECGFHIHRTCLTCTRIRDDIMECGWYWGEVWEAIHKANCDDDFCLCPSNQQKRYT